MTDDVKQMLLHLACQPTTGEVIAKDIEYVPNESSEAEADNFFEEWNACMELQDEQDNYDDGRMDGQIMLARKICKMSGIEYKIYDGYHELYDPLAKDEE